MAHPFRSLCPDCSRSGGTDAARLDSAAMRILVVGAGGVGAAFAPIAARRDFYEHIVFADIRRGASAQRRRSLRRGNGRFAAAQVDASDAAAVAELCRAQRMHAILNAVDPRFVMPIFDGAFDAGRTYLDMAMSLSDPHPDAPYELPGEKLGDDAVRIGRRVGEPRTARAGRASASSPGCPTCSRGTPPTTCSRDRRDRACATAPTSWSSGYDFAPDVLDLDHDRGMPEPAGGLGEGARLVHHCRRSREPEMFTFPEGIGPVECVNVEHEEVLLDPAVGRLQPSDLQVRPRRRVHRRAQDAAQARAGRDRAGRACAASR